MTTTHTTTRTALLKKLANAELIDETNLTADQKTLIARAADHLESLMATLEELATELDAPTLGFVKIDHDYRDQRAAQIRDLVYIHNG